MVKKSVLQKLSDQELFRYLSPTNRSVPEAVRYAYDILRERGHAFTTEEHDRIEGIIKGKIEAEQYEALQRHKNFDENLTFDEDAVELYPNWGILVFSILFGPFLASFLQFYNFLKIKKTWPAIFSLGFGAFYLLPKLLTPEFLSKIPLVINLGASIIFLPFFGLGFIGLMLINREFMPKDIKYRPKPLVYPLLLYIVITIVKLYYL